MRTETWEKINERYRRFRSFWAAPVSPDEVSEICGKLNIPAASDYCQFVIRYGGGYVGSYPIYGLRLAESMGTVNGARTAPELTEAFGKRKWPGVDQWFIFSIDQSGNPIGLAPDGTVWISDMAHGQVTPLAASFEEFLRRWALRIDPMV